MTKKEYDYIDGIIYSTSDDKTKFKLDKDDDCKDLTAYLNELINKNNDDNKEIVRLCRVMSDCHDDIRRYDTKVEKQRMIIRIQAEIIRQYSELCKISNAEFWIETENGCEKIEL